MKATIIVALTVFGGFINNDVKAQHTFVGLDSLIQMARNNNLGIKRTGLEIKQSRALQRSALDLPKTDFTLAQDPTSGGNIDNAIGVTQGFSLPILYRSQRRMFEQQTRLAEANRKVTEAEILRDVKLAYYNYLYTQEQISLLNYLDSIYMDFYQKADVRYKTGETSNLERLTAQNRSQNIHLQRSEALSDLDVYETLLRQYTNYSAPLAISRSGSSFYPQEALSFDTTVSDNPQLQYQRQNIEVAQSRVSLERARRLPDFSVSYFHQFVVKGFDPGKIDRSYFPGTRIGGFELGVSVPLFNKANKARIEAERIGVEIAQTELETTRWQLTSEYQRAYQQYLRYKQRYDFYREKSLFVSDEQIRVSIFAFSKGEISYVELVENLTQAIEIKLQYLETVQKLNEAIITINFLKGNQEKNN